MTKTEFRSDASLRAQLEKMLGSRAFQEAVKILENWRKGNEQRLDATLSADPIVSVRITSQRVGFDSFAIGLRELCEPVPLEPQPERASFGEDEALEKLEQLTKE